MGSFNTGGCFIEMTTWTGLTVYLIIQRWSNRITYSQICIYSAPKATCKCVLNEKFPFIYTFKLYALYINLRK